MSTPPKHPIRIFEDENVKCFWLCAIAERLEQKDFVSTQCDLTLHQHNTICCNACWVCRRCLYVMFIQFLQFFRWLYALAFSCYSNIAVVSSLSSPVPARLVLPLLNCQQNAALLNSLYMSWCIQLYHTRIHTTTTHTCTLSIINGFQMKNTKIYYMLLISFFRTCNAQADGSYFSVYFAWVVVDVSCSLFFFSLSLLLPVYFHWIYPGADIAMPMRNKTEEEEGSLNFFRRRSGYAYTVLRILPFALIIEWKRLMLRRNMWKNVRDDKDRRAVAARHLEIVKPYVVYKLYRKKNDWPYPVMIIIIYNRIGGQSHIRKCDTKNHVAAHWARHSRLISDLSFGIFVRMTRLSCCVVLRACNSTKIRTYVEYSGVLESNSIVPYEVRSVDPSNDRVNANNRFTFKWQISSGFLCNFHTNVNHNQLLCINRVYTCMFIRNMKFPRSRRDWYVRCTYAIYAESIWHASKLLFRYKRKWVCVMRTHTHIHTQTPTTKQAFLLIMLKVNLLLVFVFWSALAADGWPRPRLHVNVLSDRRTFACNKQLFLFSRNETNRILCCPYTLHALCSLSKSIRFIVEMIVYTVTLI